MKNYILCPHCGSYLFNDDNQDDFECDENNDCRCRWCKKKIEKDYLDDPDNWR